jgi:hypothetical protein
MRKAVIFGLLVVLLFILGGCAGEVTKTYCNDINTISAHRLNTPSSLLLSIKELREF